jgi:glutathione S-transferase
MKTDHFLVIVTLASLLVYFWMGIRVARARAKFGVPVPAITGHPEFERTYRVQVNTLEWLPIFLPSMWLFAAYWTPAAAAALGVVWIVGRVVYAFGYVKEAKLRGPGFGIQFLACAILVLGTLGRVIWLLAIGQP